jgi:hypothetical protein
MINEFVFQSLHFNLISINIHHHFISLVKNGISCEIKQLKEMQCKHKQLATITITIVIKTFTLGIIYLAFSGGDEDGVQRAKNG